MPLIHPKSIFHIVQQITDIHVRMREIRTRPRSAGENVIGSGWKLSILYVVVNLMPYQGERAITSTSIARWMFKLSSSESSGKGE